MATRQYVFVSLAKQPISLFFSKDALTAMLKLVSGQNTLSKPAGRD